MKSLLTLVFISASFLYAQEGSRETQDSYAVDLNKKAVQTALKASQNQQIGINVGNILLEGSIQRANVKLALNYYLDFTQPCVASGNPYHKEVLPSFIESADKKELICIK